MSRYSELFRTAPKTDEAGQRESAVEVEESAGIKQFSILFVDDETRSCSPVLGNGFEEPVVPKDLGGDVHHAFIQGLVNLNVLLLVGQRLASKSHRGSGHG